MLSRTILKWALLVAISVVAVFTLSLLVVNDSVRAAMDQDQEPTAGSLRAHDANGKPVGECPLKRTEVKAQVSGFISRVTVIQDFENNFDEKIEAVYTFPLPQAAAVDDLTMLIGDRIVKGKIMRREEAQEAYVAAKQLGKIASLLDQHRPNIFTQQVANILPGQRIRITISYVETLKYEDGAYEWSFPMVIGPRYIPQKDEAQQALAQTNTLTDVSFMSRTTTPNKMRAGNEISLEIDVEAGVPIVQVNSESHETEVQQINDRRSVIRLKNQAFIPNTDFVLTYRVAGNSINDAVLAHRSDRGGFFTLILQPPQRVAAEDVMPKELVFVLDTSGSMNGFPLKKAKQTMQLALDNLYPHDTFNVITFSGDTEILFSDPVPATPANLRKAKKFLEGRASHGGTEMMKAIKAALDPSDSQHHVRIAVFMTDGQVGNDAEIISEVQKHPNARVFAMGFGDSPNRFLLDRMTEYGRGEVDYVSEQGDTSMVAKRFNERVRNPLLTDISIDWSGLPVTDVYPARLPDLFSAKPVIVSGRYTAGAKGTIRLVGKMAGQNFVREIPVQLPDRQDEHDVLATLWARRRIDDLMRQDMAHLYDPTKATHREEITQLGLNFKLMTQYTSFLAIDEVIFTGGGDPIRVNALNESSSNLLMTSTVMVTSSACVVQSSTAVVTHTVARTIQDLPVQGRSLFNFVLLTPGNSNGRQFNFNVDGVDANSGITPGGESPGSSASGSSPALTASGGANGIVTLDATQEVEVQTFPTQAENGRPGTQVNVITRSGTNEFHGSAFHAFGNDAFDANDWFANALRLNQPAKRLNNFGATIGGPIERDKTFFFASYEGLRLRQPMVGITDVPSLETRSAATDGMQPFLAAFPVPSGGAKPDGFAEFAASFANPARHDVGSVRIDHMLNDDTYIRGRYSFADSGADQRGANGFSLNTINGIRTRAQTLTGSLDHLLSSTMALTLDANYSQLRVNGSYLLDEFGGAVIPAHLFSSTPTASRAGSFAFDLNSRNAAFMIGDDTSNIQRQFSLNGSMAIISGNHQYKFGSNYRLLSPGISLRQFEENVFFDGTAQAITGMATRVSRLNNSARQTPVFQNLSLFAQDEWRQSPRLTLTYGMRWELAPAPSSKQALAVDQVNDPATLNVAAPRSSLWETTFANFAPRAGFAYEISRRYNHELVLRGGGGIRYDLAHDRFSDVFAGSIPFTSGSAFFSSPFPPTSPVTTGESLPLIAFDPHLKHPYIIDWNLSLQQALGSSQAISATYFGSARRRLLHTQTLFDANPNFSFLRLTANRANSDYRALEVKFERQRSSDFAALVSYTWSESLDNVLDDSVRRIVVASSNPELDRSPSDFDIRHQLTGSMSYMLPAPISHGLGNKLFRNWALASIFNARSAKPVNVLFGFPTSVGLAYLRPNVVDGASPYILDPATAGGRRLNPAAFVIPSDVRQGDLSRNSLRGFPLYQIDLGLRRRFEFSEDVALQIHADAFNLFNHANFEDPNGNDLVLANELTFVANKLAFGQSTSMAGRSLSQGGFGSFYSFGGARSLRFSVKLLF